MIDWPRDGTMLLLAAIVGRGELDVVDGELSLVTEGRDPVPASPDALDDLEGRGWIATGDHATVTEKGVYWLTRWLRMRLGARGRVVVTGVRASLMTREERTGGK